MVDPDDGQPWDFSRRDKREKARRLLREQKPILLIGSPMCTQFSTWQYLNYSKSKDQAAMRRARAGACVHLEFVAELYHEQIDGGRYFLHEHPRHATSWKLECMTRLQEIPSVDTVQGDQCQFGAVAMKGPDRGRPVKKPSGFMSNSIEIRHALSRVCEGRNGECSRPQGGKHTTVQGSVTKSTAIYPRELCRAVLRGMTAQLRRDRRLIAGCCGIQVEGLELDSEPVDKETDGVMHGHVVALAAEVKNEDAMAEKQLFGPA